MSRRIRTMRSSRKGVVLLLVLGIIMAITLLSLGFVARCDTELACGQNMAVRVQMDQLSTSGLEHARGLLLNPQEVGEEYWTGGTGLQLDPNTNDFYDMTVAVDPTDERTFDVTCESYRLLSGEKVGSSRLSAVVQLDPCIGIWCGSNLYVHENWGIVGDVYSPHILTNLAGQSAVNGDVFAGSLQGDIVGRYQSATSLSAIMGWPPVTWEYSNPDYTISPIGPGTVSGGSYDSPGIWRSSGDLVLDGDVTINGMLWVNGNLTIEGSGVRITAAKNLPAVYVSQSASFHDVTDVQIEGLMTVRETLLVGRNCTGIHVRGALFARVIVESAVDSSGQRADCRINNVPNWIAEGVSGGAMAFDGSHTFLQTFNSSTSLQVSGDYTLSVWMKADASQKDWAGIICKTNSSGTANHWVLQFDNSVSRELVVGNGEERWSTGTVLADVAGAWHHVAVVREGNVMRFYLDGFEKKSEVFPYDPVSGYGHLNIGADRTALSSYLYKGLLDDVRVYNRALLASEITVSPDDSSLIGHWAFDGSGSQVDVVASPMKAAIAAWYSGAWTHWSPAAGAFFKRIDRD